MFEMLEKNDDKHNKDADHNGTSAKSDWTDCNARIPPNDKACLRYTTCKKHHLLVETLNTLKSVCARVPKAVRNCKDINAIIVFS